MLFKRSKFMEGNKADIRREGKIALGMWQEWERYKKRYEEGYNIYMYMRTEGNSAAGDVCRGI